MNNDIRLNLLNDFSYSISNKFDIPIILCANDNIPIQSNALDELENLIESLVYNIDLFKSCGIIKSTSSIERIVLTPDFHKGSGVPIGTVIKTNGFVIPQAIGNDVNCGMRLMNVGMTYDTIINYIDEIGINLRRVFFEGKRNIPLSREQRVMMLKYGIRGLVECLNDVKDIGIWKYFDYKKEIDSLNILESNGGYSTEDIFALNDYINSSGDVSYDSMIGSLGGGNHFVELQYVNKIYDYEYAHLLKVKEGDVLCMVHSGSLGFGHITGKHFFHLMRESFPKNVKHPKGFYILSNNCDNFYKFRSSLYNAANFAFCNRMMLSLMVKKSITDVIKKDINCELIYDSPHNFVWDDNGYYIHRKGSTPATTMFDNQGHKFQYYGNPVIVPGAMGRESYVLYGQGNNDFLNSASHGAGRNFSRGDSMKVDESLFKQFLADYRVILPVDLDSVKLKMRTDILKKMYDNIKQESPFAYKNVTPVVNSLVDANIAARVFELKPFLTVKGF